MQQSNTLSVYTTPAQTTSEMMTASLLLSISIIMLVRVRTCIHVRMRILKLPCTMAVTAAACTRRLYVMLCTWYYRARMLVKVLLYLLAWWCLYYYTATLHCQASTGSFYLCLFQIRLNSSRVCIHIYVYVYYVLQQMGSSCDMATWAVYIQYIQLDSIVLINSIFK